MRDKMLRKRSRWRTWTKTYGSEQKRNDRAYEERQWRKEASDAIMDT